VKGLSKSLRFCTRKNLSLFEHSFLLAWIIMSSLYLMSWILWKSILCILRSLFIVLGCLLAWLERTSTGT
jgi:biopolymer transport protein ExbB/TolQ